MGWGSRSVPRPAPRSVVILVDSSAWIEYLRGTQSPVHLFLAGAIETGKELATTGPVLMEVLAGARDERNGADIARLLGRVEQIAVEQPSDWEAAASIYRACRRSGTTVRRLSDCLIAAVAMRAEASLLHCDSDFDVIAERVPLGTVEVG
jgi:predicted nucleic acid-binding protein